MTLVDPFHKDMCPYCGKEIYLGECDIVSTSQGIIKLLRKPGEGIFARAWLPPLNGSKYAREQACRQCKHCQNLLPPNTGITKNYTIAIVGGVYSGKTHYIATTLHQLRMLVGQATIGYTQFMGATQETEKRYDRDYYKPVFIDKQAIATTQSKGQGTNIQREPLIFQMLFPAQPQQKRATSVNFVFYDISGEDLSNQSFLVSSAQHILNPAAVIFLADPLTMDGILGTLNSNQRPKVRQTSASDVMNWFSQTLIRDKGGVIGDKLTIPTAITISKSDMLKYYIARVMQNRSQPLFLSDQHYNYPMKTQEFQQIDREIQALLYQLSEIKLLNSSDVFADKNFFAISATGWSPDEATGDFPDIAPRRCLDPIIWILWKLGIIQLAN